MNTAFTNLKTHGLFNTMKIEDAIQYVDSLSSGAGEHSIELLTAAYVMYNSVVNHYETNMICTKRGEDSDGRDV